MLKIQNVYLTIQINTLKEDRLKLMNKLRHNAAQMVEIIIIFLGLCVDQIIKLNEYASGLRDGFIKLSLNDRFVELMADIATSKDEGKLTSSQ